MELILPRRTLGRTGASVTLLGLGGQSALEQSRDPERAHAVIEEAYRAGVRLFETSPAYGPSEQYLGEVLRGHRDSLFLVTKTRRRDHDEAMRQLEQSLKRLGTDHIDLWQIHDLREREQLEQIFAPNGALRAFIGAREEGLVRHLGVTGHYDPGVLREAIDRFDFDCVQMPLNAADRGSLSFIEQLLPRAVEKGMGIIAMKAFARGRLLRSWFPPNFRGLTAAAQALDYVASLPVHCVLMGCDSAAQVRENALWAERFLTLDSARLAQLEAMAAPVAERASFYKRGMGGGSFH